MFNNLVKKDVDANNVATPLHGTGGLFAQSGLESDILSLVVSPQGIGPLLPAIPSNLETPYFGFLYAIADSGDDEPDDVCGDAPTADLSSAKLTSAFGHVQRATKTIELATAQFRINSSDNVDLMLLGGPNTPLNQANAGAEYPSDVTSTDMLNNLFRAQMVVASHSMNMELNTMTWQGNPANATANGGYIPFTGLDSLIKTGYQDAVTTTAIPKADSIVVDAAYADIGSYDIVGQLRAVFTALENRVSNLFGSAEWVLVMRPELWDKLADVWPVLYGAEMAAAISDANVSLNMDANELVRQREAMKASKTIVINGVVRNVVTDHGILLEDSGDDASIPAGSWGSDIYVLPLRAGGMAATYWEYLDYRESVALLRAVNPASDAFWSDGGRFFWTVSEEKTCFKFQVRVRPRVILRTPHLAARVNNITWDKNAPALLLPDA